MDAFLIIAVFMWFKPWLKINIIISIQPWNWQAEHLEAALEEALLEAYVFFFVLPDEHITGEV